MVSAGGRGGVKSLQPYFIFYARESRARFRRLGHGGVAKIKVIKKRWRKWDRR